MLIKQCLWTAAQTVKFSHEIACVRAGLSLENSLGADKGDYSITSAVPFIFRGIRKGIGLCWMFSMGRKEN